MTVERTNQRFQDRTGRFIPVDLDECRKWVSPQRRSRNVEELYYTPNGVWALCCPNGRKFITEPEAAKWFEDNSISPPIDLLGRYFPGLTTSSTTTTNVTDFNPKALTVNPRLLGFDSPPSRFSETAVSSATQRADGVKEKTESQDTRATHSPDFRSVYWFGTIYSFTPKQAVCVEILWGAWDKGAPDIGEQTILSKAESDQNRLKNLFRGSPAWETMIARGSTKGSFRLCEPS